MNQKKLSVDQKYAFCRKNISFSFCFQIWYSKSNISFHEIPSFSLYSFIKGFSITIFFFNFSAHCSNLGVFYSNWRILILIIINIIGKWSYLSCALSMYLSCQGNRHPGNWKDRGECCFAYDSCYYFVNELISLFQWFFQFFAKKYRVCELYTESWKYLKIEVTPKYWI